MLGYDIPGKKLSFMLPTSGNGIVENLPFESFHDFFPIRACGLHNVAHIHPAVEIEAACQCLERCQSYTCVYLFESHRLTHDV